jgi:putative transposase
MLQTFSALWIHMIWATKNREPLIHTGFKNQLYSEIRSIAEEKGYYLDFINGMEDHVHCLLSFQSVR